MKTRIQSIVLILFLAAACQPEKALPTAEAIPPAATAAITTATPAPPETKPTSAATAPPETSLVTAPTSTPVLTATERPGLAKLSGQATYPLDKTAASLNPLTGLPVADPSRLERRPIGVKINIVPRSWNRPPWGLSLADIVYDYYHNAGYSRFHAIFYGNDAEYVGPIRSGRLFDNDLILMYKSIFAYGGADTKINYQLFNAPYADRLIMEGQRTECPLTAEQPLCRYETAAADLLVGSTQTLSAHISAKGVENGRQDLAGMVFDERPPDGGSNGSQVYVHYSIDNYLRWDYAAGSGRYLRFQDNVFDTGGGEEYAPLTDRLDGAQIAADNVVILIVPHAYAQRPPYEIVEILLDGSGPAYIFRDGQMYSVTWNRPTPEAVLFLTGPDGSPFPFKPGATWFQVIGTSSKIVELGEGVYRYEFGFP